MPSILRSSVLFASVLGLVACDGGAGEISNGGTPIKATDNTSDGGGGGGGGGGGDGGDGGDGGGGGDAYGSFSLFILNAGCDITWEAAGSSTSCGGCAYAFDLDLSVDRDNCGGAGDFSGTIEFDRGSAYFEGSEIGYYYDYSGYIGWRTSGYIYGAGGGYYYYSGYLSVD